MLHYFILAHKNPNQVGILVNRLTWKNNKIYIHVDKHCDIKDFLYLKEKAIFIKKRTKINWGWFNMIKATIEWYKQILPKMNKGDHVILMSGQDLPIKSQNEIHDLFGQYPEKSMVNYHEDTKDHFNSNKNITKYYFNDYLIPSRIDNIFKFCIKAIKQDYDIVYRRRQAFWGIVNRISNMLPQKTYLIKNYKPYGGSQRQAISYNHLKYILNFLETSEGRKFYKAFRYTNCPDERFFQMLLLNSKHRNEIENKLLWHITRTTKWSRSPDTLKISDFEILEKSEKLFARKFDIHIDSEIIKKIEIVSTKNN